MVNNEDGHVRFTLRPFDEFKHRNDLSPILLNVEANIGAQQSQHGDVQRGFQLAEYRSQFLTPILEREKEV